MPLYDFVCAEGHEREARRGYEEGVIICPEPGCGEIAVRSPIYESQYLVTETGAKQHRRADVPRDERYLKPKDDLFREAAQEVDYGYSRVEASTGREVRTRFFQQGLARARALRANGVTAREFAARSAS